MGAPQRQPQSMGGGPQMPPMTRTQQPMQGGLNGIGGQQPQSMALGIHI
jgi:hypothetical protein